MDTIKANISSSKNTENFFENLLQNGCEDPTEDTENFFQSLLQKQYEDRSLQAQKGVAEKRASMLTLLENGSSFLLSEKYELAIPVFLEALRIFAEDEYPDEFGLTETQIMTIKFTLCYCYVHSDNRDSFCWKLQEAEEMLEDLYKNYYFTFPAVNYLYAKLLTVNNRYDEGLDIIHGGITILDKCPTVFEYWPGTNVIINLTDSRLLREAFSELERLIYVKSFVHDIPNCAEDLEGEVGDQCDNSRRTSMNIHAKEYYPLQVHTSVFLQDRNLKNMSSKNSTNSVESMTYEEELGNAGSGLAVKQTSLQCNFSPRDVVQKEISIQTDKLHTKDKAIGTTGSWKATVCHKDSEKGNYRNEFNELKSLLSVNVSQDKETIKELQNKLKKLEKENVRAMRENSHLKSKLVEYERIQLDEEKVHFQKEEMYKQITAAMQETTEKLEKKLQDIERDKQENEDVSKVAWEKMRRFNLYAIQQIFKAYSFIFDSVQSRSQKMLCSLRDFVPICTPMSIPSRQETIVNIMKWEALLNHVKLISNGLRQHQCNLLVEMSNKESFLKMADFPTFPDFPQEPSDVFQDNFKNAIMNIVMPPPAMVPNSMQNPRLGTPPTLAGPGPYQGSPVRYPMSPPVYPAMPTQNHQQKTPMPSPTTSGVKDQTFQQLLTSLSLGNVTSLQSIPLYPNTVQALESLVSPSGVPTIKENHTSMNVQIQQSSPSSPSGVPSFKENLNSQNTQTQRPLASLSEVPNTKENLNPRNEEVQVKRPSPSPSSVSSFKENPTSQNKSSPFLHPSVSLSNVTSPKKSLAAKSLSRKISPETKKKWWSESNLNWMGNQGVDTSSGQFHHNFVQSVAATASTTNLPRSPRTISENDKSVQKLTLGDFITNGCERFEREKSFSESQAGDGQFGDKEILPLTMSNLKVHEAKTSSVSTNALPNSAASKKSGNTDKLIKLIQSKFPEKTGDDCRAVIGKCREKIGPLKGLTGAVLMKCIEEIFEKENRTNIPKSWARISTGPIKWSKDSGSYEECAICIDSITESASTKTLTCQHTFHATCIQQWMQTNSICPICRLYTTIEEDYPPLPNSQTN